MNPDASPFTPDVPASADIFVGRERHVKDLLAAVRKAKSGKLSVAWIGGERGIGKSSLAAYVGAAAEINDNALFAHVPLGGVNTLGEMARVSYRRLLQENRNKSWGENVSSMFSKWVKEVDAFGVKIDLNMKKEELPSTMEDFAEALTHIAGKVPGRDVLTLVFDDINGIAGEPFFAHGIKSMVDGLAIRKAHIPVCMIFTGLDERLNDMCNVNPSVVRCFQPRIDVEPWTQAESAEFFQKAFKGADVTVSHDKIKTLAESCRGIPSVAHELGHAVWREAENKKIEPRVIRISMAMTAHAISGRFMQKDTDKSILRKIAEKCPWHFSRDSLLDEGFLTDEEEKVLDDFLRRMRKLGGIYHAGSEPGIYRLRIALAAALAAEIRNGKKQPRAVRKNDE